MRGIRIAGTIILALSLVYSAISGDWPSGHAILVLVAAGTLAGLAGGIALRAAMPREQRRALIRKGYPRIGARLPPQSERDTNSH